MIKIFGCSPNIFANEKLTVRTCSADRCNENKDIYCFSQSKIFAFVKGCGKEPEKQ